MCNSVFLEPHLEPRPQPQFSYDELQNTDSRVLSAWQLMYIAPSNTGCPWHEEGGLPVELFTSCSWCRRRVEHQHGAQNHLLSP